MTDVSDTTTMSADDPNQTDRLIALALESAELFHNQDRTAFAAITENEVRQTIPIKSEKAEHWLLRQFHARHGHVPGQYALGAALKSLAALATVTGQQRSTFVRVGEHDDRHYIDLGDPTWRAIEVSSTGWGIVQKPAVFFRRRAMTGVLTEPIVGGSIDDLRSFVTVDDDQFKLIVGWMLMALHPRGPYPPLVLQGEQGSAKSTTAKMLKALVDPATPSLRSLPTNERDLAIAANGEWVLAFDNMSGMPTRMSDALCRLSTGGGVSARKLYTDDEERVFDLKRPLMLNGLDAIITRQDLISRSVIVELPRLAPHQRRGERELWEEFDAARASIVGGLLNAISVALANTADTRVDGGLRMADFARYVTAAEPALGWTSGTFIEVYAANQASALTISLEGDIVAMAVMSLLEANDGEWAGTPATLHGILAQYVPLEQRKPRWPANAQALGRSLTRLAPALRERAIYVERTSAGRGRDKERIIEIWRDTDGDGGDATASNDA